jgi:plastocyanin
MIFTTEARRARRGFLILRDLLRVLRVSVVIFFLANGSVLADDQTIEFFNTSFLPQSVSVDLGDKVIWVWQAGTHTITSGVPDGQAGTIEEPGSLFDVPIDQAHPGYSYTFLQSFPDGLSFFCRNHPAQIGTIATSTGEATFRVGVVDNFFIPGEIYIFEGDSIRWEHELNEGFHTVTSGLSSRPEDHPGALFDAESSNDRPNFTYRFDGAGDYPYFCIPHEDMGMKGVIRVQKRFLRGDAQTDGAIDLTDVYSLLEFLFLGEAARACPDALDANDDGAVDISDPIYLIFFLFDAGPPPPKPRVVPGADRTDDDLLCRP